MKEKYLKNLAQALIENNQSQYYIDLCLDYAERILDNNLPVIFDNIHLSKVLGLPSSVLGYFINSNDRFYRNISIPKRRGGKRKLSIPTNNLKFIQRWILKNILEKISVSDESKAFVRGLSIVDNAKLHCKKKYLITIDIKDFFPSIHTERIFKIFKYYGYTKEVSYTFSKLCTHKDSLPQGSPTSPYLSNLVCKKLDYRLSTLCNQCKAIYSRYADDITISSDANILKFIPIFFMIIENEGFSINMKKFRVQSLNKRQVVTGLVVNNGVKVLKSNKRELRQIIYYCKKFGVLDHQKKVKMFNSNFKDHLYGKAFFIKMVEPKLGEDLLSELNKIYW